IREITVAARAGGPDPDANPRLRLAWDKATAANMPKDNIQRAIQRGAGGADGANYEEVRYEGYGPGGAAILIDCMTDNRTRTVAEVRHALTKNGGNLGQEGSVTFMFKHCGQFLFAPGVSEEQVMEVALEAGAEDIETDEDRSEERRVGKECRERTAAVQAEDGIRDFHVTGVQTCALPIYSHRCRSPSRSHQKWRQPRPGRLRHLYVQALRPVPLRSRRIRGTSHGSGAGSRCRRHRDR